MNYLQISSEYENYKQSTLLEMEKPKAKIEQYEQNPSLSNIEVHEQQELLYEQIDELYIQIQNVREDNV